MRRSGARAFVALVLGALPVVSCSLPASAPVGGESPQRGGTLRVGLDYSPTCLDPQQAGQMPNLGVVDTLIRQNPDNGEWERSLASSWEVNADSTVFTFDIRDGVTFSDGSPLDAHVVKANLDNIAALGGKASGGGVHLLGLAGVAAPDNRTVVVRFREPNVPFLQATSTSAFGILSPATLATAPAQRCAGKVSGTGPFVLDAYRPRQRIELSRRPGYVSPPWSPRTGGAHLDRVEIRIIPEDATRVGSLRSGQIDVATAIPPQDESLFDTAGFATMSRILPGVVLSLFVNEHSPQLGDPAVRKAIQRSINRSDVVRAFLSERYRPATSVLSTKTPGYVDLGANLTHDPRGARKLLDSAGWRVGADGIRVKDGRRLSVDVVFGKPRGLELIQQQLREVGIELRLRQLQISELQEQLSAGNYDLFLGDSTRADPAVLRARTMTGNLVLSAELTRALDIARSTLDPTRRAEAVARAQRAFVVDGHVIPINEQAQVLGVSDRVHGLSFTANSDLSLDETWLG